MNLEAISRITSTHVITTPYIWLCVSVFTHVKPKRAHGVYDYHTCYLI